MKTLIVALTSAVLLCAFEVEDKASIHQTFPASARLDLDNVSGSIHVTGYSGSEIVMDAQKSIHAESQDRLDAAKRDVKLDISQAGGELKLFVDGPFRCHCADGGSGVHDHGHRGYDVRYDFELKVPAATVLRLATVNGGHVRVENTSGDFHLHNVNGAIELSEVAGSGTAHTVNGGITASFAGNPAAATSFKTVNGAIEASFRPNLAADLQLRILHGGVFTDFDVAALPNPAPVPERRDGKFVYRSDRSTAMRIAAGGAQLSFQTLNGSIRITKRGQ